MFEKPLGFPGPATTVHQPSFNHQLSSIYPSNASNVHHSTIKYIPSFIKLSMVLDGWTSTLCRPRSAHRSRGKGVALGTHRRGPQAGTQQDGGQHAQHVTDKIDLGPGPCQPNQLEQRPGGKLGIPKDWSHSINSQKTVKTC